MCLAQGHNAVTQVRLEPTVLQSQVKHSTTEPLRSGMQHHTPYIHMSQVRGRSWRNLAVCDHRTGPTLLSNPSSMFSLYGQDHWIKGC